MAHPDQADAIQHLRRARADILRRLGLTASEINLQINKEIDDVARRTEGQRPLGDLLYDLGVAFGYRT